MRQCSRREHDETQQAPRTSYLKVPPSRKAAICFVFSSGADGAVCGVAVARFRTPEVFAGRLPSVLAAQPSTTPDPWQLLRPRILTACYRSSRRPGFSELRFISLRWLRMLKAKAARHKDLDDLEHLPPKAGRASNASDRRLQVVVGRLEQGGA